MRICTTEIIRQPDQDGLEYDQQSHINYEWAGKRLSDKRRWNDAVKEDGLKDFYSAVKEGRLPKPVVEPIRRQA